MNSWVKTVRRKLTANEDIVEDIVSWNLKVGVWRFISGEVLGGLFKSICISKDI